MRVALALVVVSLAAAGCGSDDEAGGETTADADVSAHQELIAEGDALCADAQDEAADLAGRAQEIRARQGTASEEELLAETAELWADQVELIERFRGQLADLDAPEEDEPRIEEFLASLDEGLAIARDITARLEDGEEPPQTQIQSYTAEVAHGNELARAFGFKVCGSGAS